VLPDGILFSKPKNAGSECLAMIYVGKCYGHFVDFTAIWYVLWPFGNSVVILVYFFQFWYVAPRKIWQPCCLQPFSEAKIAFRFFEAASNSHRDDDIHLDFFDDFRLFCFVFFSQNFLCHGLRTMFAYTFVFFVLKRRCQ
jgi:hypothetical protein